MLAVLVSVFTLQTHSVVAPLSYLLQWLIRDQVACLSQPRGQKRVQPQNCTMEPLGNRSSGFLQVKKALTNLCKTNVPDVSFAEQILLEPPAGVRAGRIILQGMGIMTDWLLESEAWCPWKIGGRTTMKWSIARAGSYQCGFSARTCCSGRSCRSQATQLSAWGSSGDGGRRRWHRTHRV